MTRAPGGGKSPASESAEPAYSSPAEPNRRGQATGSQPTRWFMVPCQHRPPWGGIASGERGFSGGSMAGCSKRETMIAALCSATARQLRPAWNQTTNFCPANQTLGWIRYSGVMAQHWIYKAILLFSLQL
ncbi:hypothetical protein MHYP_G00322740 [Metynnis hypsauchen]